MPHLGGFMSRMAILSLLVVLLPIASSQQKPAKPKEADSANANPNETKIARALSAAPSNVSDGARIVDRDENGAETVLREGNNGFTCFPGHPGVVGDFPYCANAAALRWESDFLALRPKPTNTEPGIEYMLQGGSDWSASDPYAITGTPINEPPHWMILWPFDAKTTGLPTEPKQTGSWIMWANTPWAHLMINQKP
jgi:hypothetical protein